MVNLMDPAQRQGPRIRHRVLPGWKKGCFPRSARSRKPGSRARGGATARLCRADPGAAPGAGVVRRNAAAFTASGIAGALALCRRMPKGPDRGRDRVGLGPRRLGTRPRRPTRPGARPWGEGYQKSLPRPPLVIEQVAAPPARGLEIRKIGGFFGRRPGIPPEIRLPDRPGGRGQQARNQFRARRRQEGDGRLCRARVTRSKQGILPGVTGIP